MLTFIIYKCDSWQWINTFCAFVEELKENRGTQYADWLVDILDEEDVIKRLDNRLIELRDKNYEITFDKIKIFSIE